MFQAHGTPLFLNFILPRNAVDLRNIWTLKSIHIKKYYSILFYRPKKLLYQLYHTILQYFQHPKILFFFPFYLNILFYSFFYCFSFSLPFPLSPSTSSTGLTHRVTHTPTTTTSTANKTTTDLNATISNPQTHWLQPKKKPIHRQKHQQSLWQTNPKSNPPWPPHTTQTPIYTTDPKHQLADPPSWTHDRLTNSQT